MTIAKTIAGRAALLIAVLLAAYQCSEQPESAAVNQQLTTRTTIQPLPTQDCDPRGCGLIDFEHHPELIGGGIVLEPTN